MTAGAVQPPSLQVAHTVVDSLVELGVRLVAYCPGSRNAPFAYVLDAAEREGLLRVEIFSDERSAGFWAVGAARGLVAENARCPVVPVVTTSGTAAVELSPAMREAHHQGLPVLAVTADRPHESRGVGASQTTDQERLYGPSVVAQCSIPADTSYSPARLRQIRDQVARVAAAVRGTRGAPGPGHVNIAFREPLVPNGTIPTFREHRRQMAELSPAYSTYPEWEDVVDSHLRTVVVAGDSADPHVVAAAAARQIPVLAEPSSGVCGTPTWVPHAPFIVTKLASSVQQVVVTGNPSLSRPVAALLGDPRLRKIVVSRDVPWVDVTGTAAVITEGLADTLPVSFDGQRRAYLTRWLDAAKNAERIVAGEPGLNLFSVCRAVWQSAGEENLWLGASNTVRGFELAAGLPGRGDVFSNRGLAGIDGTIASAAGAAAATGRPLRAVMGDLTFTADLSTLAQQLEGSPNLQLIVLDDGGGSIFASLEHGEERFRGLYERYFAAAPRLHGPNVADACGWHSTGITDEDELRRALAEPIVGRSLLWVRIPRPASLIARVAAQLE